MYSVESFTVIVLETNAMYCQAHCPRIVGKYVTESTYLHERHLEILDGRKSQLISTEKTSTMADAADVSGELPPSSVPEQVGK